MAVQPWSLRDWLAEVLDEAQDTLGAYELTLGGAMLLGYLLMWWLRARPGWGLGLLWLLSVVGLWVGALLEENQFRRLGRRRFRGTLYRRISWLVLVGALVLAGLLVWFAHARAWNDLAGWHDGPVWMLLTLSFYHLALGLKTGTRRWVWLGSALCVLAIALPGVAALRSRLYVATALLGGGSLLAAGLVGRLRFERALAVGRTPRERTGVSSD